VGAASCPERRKPFPGLHDHFATCRRIRSGDRHARSYDMDKCLLALPAGVEAGARTHTPCRLVLCTSEVGGSCVRTRRLRFTFALCRCRAPGWWLETPDRHRAPARRCLGLLRRYAPEPDQPPLPLLRSGQWRSIISGRELRILFCRLQPLALSASPQLQVPPPFLALTHAHASQRTHSASLIGRQPAPRPINKP